MSSTQHPDELPTVLSLHGIRTMGAWQDTFANVSGHEFRVEGFKYGRYGLRQFLVPPNNDRMITRFYEWVYDLRQKEPRLKFEYPHRPSIVAHSFGTWIVGQAMLKHADLQFDKLIFSGSILPEDFDWPTLFARNQVAFVRNEYGELDPWPRLAPVLVPRTGSAGCKGFDWYSSAVDNVPCEWFGHDDALLRPHIANHWLPALRRKTSPVYLLHGRQIDGADKFVSYLNHTAEFVDSDVFPNPEEAVLPRGLSTGWIGINPDIYTFLMDNTSNLPAGYINAMPVSENAYRDIRSGRVIDKEVRPEHIRPFMRDAKQKIYVMSLGIAEPYRRYGDGVYQYGLIQLLTGFLDKLVWYSKTQNVQVTHLLATSWTPHGRELCDQFGMIEVGRDRFDHSIFELDVTAARAMPARALRDAPMLRRFLKAYEERA